MCGRRYLLKQTLFFVLIILLFLSPSLEDAQAGIVDSPDPLRGWTHAPYPVGKPDTIKRAGLFLTGKDVQRSSPVIAEIDGNEGNGREVAIVGSDAMLYVYRSDASLLWQQSLLERGATCRVADRDTAAASSVSVGDLYGDGVPHIVVGYGTLTTASDCAGGVLAIRGVDGVVRWRYNLRHVSPTENLHAVTTTPTLADTDGDGKLEVAIGGLDRDVHLLNYNGTQRWVYHAADTVQSSPVFMNIDRDSALELIVATDISENPNVIPPTRNGGFLHAFDTQPVPGVDIRFQTGFIWRRYFDQALYSSPAVGDVLESNPGNEVVIGSGCVFPYSTAEKIGQWVKIVRPSDGTVLQTLIAKGCVPTSPALGDIDEDGKLEIVASTFGVPSSGVKSYVQAWNPESPNPMWSTIVTDPNGTNTRPLHDHLLLETQSPVIADLDGNGSLEVAVTNWWSVHVLRGKNGQPLTCQNTSCGSQTALFAWKTLKGTPAIGDINMDGKLDLVIGGGNVIYQNIIGQERGALYAWTNFDLVLNSAPGTLAPYSAPWPMMRQNATRTGVMPAPGKLEVVGNLTVMHDAPGTPARGTLLLKNVGEQPLEFNIDSVPNRVNLLPTSGVIAGGDSLSVRVSIGTNNLNNGTHSLGTLTFESFDYATSARLNVASVPLSLYLGDVRQLYLPTIE